MTKAPDRILAYVGSVNAGEPNWSWGNWSLEVDEEDVDWFPTEYVRADLYQELKDERDRLLARCKED